MLTHPTDFSTAVLIDFGLAKLVPKIISEKEDKKKGLNCNYDRIPMQGVEEGIL